jgi:selenocysteine-specific elongation factor
MLAAAAREDWAEAVAGWMQIAAPRPILAPELERRFGLEAMEVSRWLTGKKRRGPADALALRGGEMFTTGASVEALTTQLLSEVERYHAAHPHEPGLSLETLRTTLVTRAGREVTDLALDRAAKTNRLLTAQGIACLPEFAKSAGPQARAAADRVLAELEAAALDGASEAALVTRLPADGAEVVKSALARLAGESQARRLTGIWFAESAISELRRKVVAHLQAHGKLTVPELKDLAGVSRKQAIPLLEQLDREGTTRRQGDERVLGAAAKR